MLRPNTFLVVTFSIVITFRGGIGSPFRHVVIRPQVAEDWKGKYFTLFFIPFLFVLC